MASDSTFGQKIKTITLLVIGAIILIVHALIFKANQYMFTIIMCIYIIGYTILVVVLMYKNKKCYNAGDFDILLNMSLYNVFLELFLIALTIWFMYKK